MSTRFADASASDRNGSDASLPPNNGCGGIQDQVALEEMCRSYWRAVYGLIRCHGHGVQETEDLTQSFFAHAWEKHWLDSTAPLGIQRPGFLHSSVDHFLANAWRKSHAARRGGGQAPLKWDEAAAGPGPTEPVTRLDPEKMVERKELAGLLRSALERLREAYQSNGQSQLYDAISDFATDASDRGDYAALSHRLGMSQAAVSTAICRLRHRYRELILEELAQVDGTQENDPDIRALFQAVS